MYETYSSEKRTPVNSGRKVPITTYGDGLIYHRIWVVIWCSHQVELIDSVLVLHSHKLMTMMNGNQPTIQITHPIVGMVFLLKTNIMWQKEDAVENLRIWRNLYDRGKALQALPDDQTIHILVMNWEQLVTIRHCQSICAMMVILINLFLMKL